jgi:pimeloyl-ACP methyl ester carboxylesterase
MSAIILTDEIVHYEVLGRGRPLIFLHGWVGSWRYWIPTMQSASMICRTYALDFWGFGDTAKHAPNYTYDQQVQLLDQFLNELGIGKIALVGHDFGALIAMLFAIRYPACIDRMVLVSLPSDISTINPRLHSATVTELADWLLSRTPGSEAARAEAPKADQLAIQTSLSEIHKIQFPNLFRGVRVPYLCVYGQNDPAISLPRPDLLSALPDNSHMIVFEASAHYPMLDESSKFNRLLVDFLALGSGESPRQLQLKEEWKRRVR